MGRWKLALFPIAALIAAVVAYLVYQAAPVRVVASMKLSAADLPEKQTHVLQEGEAVQIILPSGQAIVAWAARVHTEVAGVKRPSGLEVELGSAPGRLLERRVKPGFDESFWEAPPPESNSSSMIYHRLATRHYVVDVIEHIQTVYALELEVAVASRNLSTEDIDQDKILADLGTGGEPRAIAMDSIVNAMTARDPLWKDVVEVRRLIKPYLHDVNERVRQAAQRCLLATGDETAILGAIAPAPQPQYAGLEGGLKVGTWCQGQSCPNVIDQALALLRSNAANERAFGLGFFQSCPDDKAMVALVAVMADPAPEFRLNALRAILKAGPGDAQASQAVVRAMDDQDHVVRDEAIVTAGKLCDDAMPGGVPLGPILAKLQHDDVQVRLMAMHAVAFVRPLKSQKDPLAAAVVEASRDSSADLRRTAAELLGSDTLRWANGSYERLVEMLRDAQPIVRQTAALSLIRVGDARAIVHLKRAMNSEKDDAVREAEQAAVTAMTKLGG